MKWANRDFDRNYISGRFAFQNSFSLILISSRAVTVSVREMYETRSESATALSRSEIAGRKDVTKSGNKAFVSSERSKIDN